MAAVPGHHGEHLAGEGDVVAQGLHGGELDGGGEVLGVGATGDDVVLAVGEETKEVLRRPGQLGDEGAVEVGIVGATGVGEGGEFLTGGLVGGDADVVAQFPINPLFVDKIDLGGGVVGAQVLDGGVEGE